MSSRFKKHSRQRPEEEEGLLVFGYSSRIYSNDSRSELIAGESHLQTWPMDETVLIDRFDVRLLLSTVPLESRGRVEMSRDEEKEERECEDERWKDLHEAELASLKRMEEEEVRPKKAEFSFSYDQPSSAPPSSSRVEEEEGDDSEDEPFVPPPGIKLPLGLETPDNQKLNHVIERTAMFVVKQGPQMEIVIKAKQRTNQEQFGFLHFDHILNPYYKYIMKLIREGKYTPDIEPKKKKSSTNGTIHEEQKGSTIANKTSGNALTALMAQHGSDSDSDSDCELHPSLLAGSRRGGSPDPVEKGEKSFAGPMKKPTTPPPNIHRSDYRIETANDAYSTLFKNLTMMNREKEQEEVERAEKKQEEKEKTEIDEQPVVREDESEESHREWEDFTDWFISFYGMSPPLPFCNMPYIPPPPDMEKALSGYARYVGENGPEAEFALKGRVELQLHFLTPSNPHHLYYLSAVRRAQWEKDQRESQEVMSNAVVPPPPPLNRKQRRMAFMDAPQVNTAPLPSVVDPTALLLASASLPHSYETSMHKSASSPVLMTSSPSYSSPLPMSPAPPPPPPSDVSSLSSLTLLPCPVPPNISTLGTPSQIAKPKEIMTERQLKARLFMEKILNDKRKKKEEETTKGVEGMEEGEIVESEEKEGRRGRREGRKEKEKEKEKGKEEKKVVSTSFFDDLIKSKMNELLKETVPGSLAVEKKNEEIKESKRAEDEKEKERKEEKEKEKERERERRDKDRRDKEREERKRKKEKKEKKRRSRSRTSSDEDRRRRRRRSRSASSDIPSKYRRR